MKKRFLTFGVILMCFVVFVCSACSSRSDKYESWHLNAMNVDKLWEYSKGGSQTIAFIDTGISDELCEDLKDRIVTCYNVIDENDNVQDIHGHGTEMISVACGSGFKGVYGIAPNSRIIVIKAVSDEGKTNNKYLYRALKFADENGATVVNISIGGYKTDESVVEQINAMTDKNITIIAAGGDYQNKDLLFPANRENVVSVEALTQKNGLWEQSNRSDSSVVRMPGEDIDVITMLDGKTVKSKSNGTSQATAVTSGYAALLRDRYKSAEQDAILEKLRSLDTKSGNKIDYTAPFCQD